MAIRSPEDQDGDPSYPPDWDDARQAYDDGRWEEAASRMEEACRGYPPSHPMHRWRGQALVKLRRYDEARLLLEAYVAGAPKDCAGWFWLAEALQGLNDHPHALSCVEEAIRLAPEQWHYWGFKADVLGELNRWEDALRACDVAASIGMKEDEYFHSDRAYILCHLGRHEEALAVVEAGMEIASEDWRLWHTKALALAKMDRIEDAERALQRALEIKNALRRGRGLRN